MSSDPAGDVSADVARFTDESAEQVATWREVAQWAVTFLESDHALMLTHPQARQARDLLVGATVTFDRDGRLPTLAESEEWDRAAREAPPLLPPEIARYRQDHVIVPVVVRKPGLGPIHVCEHDGIRVHPAKGNRWYHDPTEVRRASAAGIAASV